MNIEGLVVRKWCPRVVMSSCFDAYPWQLLGPKHLRKLPRVGVTRASALAEDRFELWLDDLPRWYPTRRDVTQVRTEGRRLLVECLSRETRQSAGASHVANQRGNASSSKPRSLH